MKTYKLTTLIVVLGAGACSTQPDHGSQQGSTQVVAAAVATPADSAGQTAPASGTQAAVPTQAGTAPAATAVASPPTISTPPVTPPPSFDTASQAASGALGTLANVVSSDPGSKRGFASSAEVNASSLGDGLPVQFVRLDKLTKFAAGQDTKALAIDKQETIFPIIVNGGVRSSVTVQKGQDGKWQAVKFGNASVAQNSQSLRGKLASARAVDAGSVSLIEIPTVHAFLLSHTEKGVHMVTPLRDIPDTSFTSGVTQPAAQVFAALQTLAAKVNLTVPN